MPQPARLHCCTQGVVLLGKEEEAEISLDEEGCLCVLYSAMQAMHQIKVMCLKCLHGPATLLERAAHLSDAPLLVLQLGKHFQKIYTAICIDFQFEIIQSDIHPAATIDQGAKENTKEMAVLNKRRNRSAIEEKARNCTRRGTLHTATPQ